MLLEIDGLDTRRLRVGRHRPIIPNVQGKDPAGYGAGSADSNSLAKRVNAGQEESEGSFKLLIFNALWLCRTNKTLHRVGVDDEFPFLLQTVFECRSEGIERRALLGLEQLLLDLVGLRGQFGVVDRS